MSNMDVMYRAYRQLEEAMNSSKSYLNFKKNIKNTVNEDDFIDSKISIGDVDMDWVEAIEEAIPYIYAAIREQRKFIVQNDEIVPIEKSRKITSESVRHLAQHTNMIASVKGNEVTPEKILNIYREESYAIYENRFLKTLIIKIADFVEKRYKELSILPNESFAGLSFDRKFKLNNDDVSFELKFSTDFHEINSVDLGEDISNLTNFQRILRIRRVISDFFSSPLLLALKNTEVVRPPIVRTNLMTKNPNFKKALDLWIFLETYEKNGYYITNSNNRGELNESIKDDFYNLIALTRFIVKMNLSDDTKDKLEVNYQKENERIKKEEEIKLENLIQRRINEALGDLKKQYSNSLKSIRDIYEDKIKKKDTEYAMKIVKLNNTYEDNLELLRRNNALEKTELTGKYESEISKLNEDYSHKIEDLMSLHRKEIADIDTEYNQKISEMSLKYNSEIKSLIDKNNLEIRKLKESFNIKFQSLKSERELHEKELNLRIGSLVDEKEKMIKEFGNFKVNMSKQIDNLKAEIKKLNTRNKASQDEINRLKKENGKLKNAGSLKEKVYMLKIFYLEERVKRLNKKMKNVEGQEE